MANYYQFGTRNKRYLMSASYLRWVAITFVTNEGDGWLVGFRISAYSPQSRCLQNCELPRPYKIFPTLQNSLASNFCFGSSCSKPLHISLVLTGSLTFPYVLPHERTSIIQAIYFVDPSFFLMHYLRLEKNGFNNTSFSHQGATL
jgi:hypothetical protein